MGTLGAQDVPDAQRVGRAGWRDPRLWGGVVLVAASVVIGAQVVSGADDTVGVWAVPQAIAEGDRVSEGGLVERRVRFADAADAELYLPVAEGFPALRHVDRTLGAGELVPRAALVAQPQGQAQVAVSVATGQVPPSVRPGGVVDLWETPPSAASERPARLLAAGVTVVRAPEVESDLTGAVDHRQVVLSLADDEETLASVIAASGSGQLMLVGRG